MPLIKLRAISQETHSRGFPHHLESQFTAFLPSSRIFLNESKPTSFTVFYGWQPSVSLSIKQPFKIQKTEGMP
jgi:hypothetical protein